jgi:hypothetical protein
LTEGLKDLLWGVASRDLGSPAESGHPKQTPTMSIFDKMRSFHRDFGQAETTNNEIIRFLLAPATRPED